MAVRRHEQDSDHAHICVCVCVCVCVCSCSCWCRLHTDSRTSSERSSGVCSPACMWLQKCKRRAHSAQLGWCCGLVCGIITKLPLQPDATSEAAQEADQRAKDAMKRHADVDQCTRPSRIQVGDSVLLKKPPTHKAAPMFDSRPFKVIRLNGNQVVILDEDGRQYVRNVSLVKLLPPTAATTRPTLRTRLVHHHQAPAHVTDDEEDDEQEVEEALDTPPVTRPHTPAVAATAAAVVEAEDYDNEDEDTATEMVTETGRPQQDDTRIEPMLPPPCALPTTTRPVDASLDALVDNTLLPVPLAPTKCPSAVVMTAAVDSADEGDDATPSDTSIDDTPMPRPLAVTRGASARPVDVSVDSQIDNTLPPPPLAPTRHTTAAVTTARPRRRSTDRTAAENIRPKYQPKHPDEQMPRPRVTRSQSKQNENDETNK